jgi:hypothetical protein
MFEIIGACEVPTCDACSSDAAKTKPTGGTKLYSKLTLKQKDKAVEAVEVAASVALRTAH